jgi:hypothetical protein
MTDHPCRAIRVRGAGTGLARLHHLRGRAVDRSRVDRRDRVAGLARGARRGDARLGAPARNAHRLASEALRAIGVLDAGRVRPGRAGTGSDSREEEGRDPSSKDGDTGDRSHTAGVGGHSQSLSIRPGAFDAALIRREEAASQWLWIIASRLPSGYAPGTSAPKAATTSARPHGDAEPSARREKKQRARVCNLREIADAAVLLRASAVIRNGPRRAAVNVRRAPQVPPAGGSAGGAASLPPGRSGHPYCVSGAERAKRVEAERTLRVIGVLN